MSTKTGRAPVWLIVSEVAMKLLADGDDLVSGADAQGFEGDIDGVRPVGAADAMLHAVLLGEGLLEALDVLAADEGGLVDDGLDGRVDLGLEGQVLGFEVDEWNVHECRYLLNKIMCYSWT